jgi:hypothetical protein
MARAKTTRAPKSAEVDLPRVLDEASRLALGRPLPVDLSVAMLADSFRDASFQVNDPELLTISRSLDHRQRGLVSILARMTSVPSFQEAFQTMARLDRGEGARRPLTFGRKTLGRWLEAVGPLRFEEVIDNPQRQEELVRKWLATIDLPVRGETSLASQKKLDQIDSNTAAVARAWLEEEGASGGSPNFATSRRAKGTVTLLVGLGAAVLPGLLESTSSSSTWIAPPVPPSTTTRRRFKQGVRA